MNLSLSRYRGAPATRFGRLTLREAPPPGVLITPTNPSGSGLTALIVPGNWATNPVGTVVTTPLMVAGHAAAAHWITTSGRVIPISIGRPVRALTIAPNSQSPRTALPTVPNSWLVPLPNGSL